MRSAMAFTLKQKCFLFAALSVAAIWMIIVRVPGTHADPGIFYVDALEGEDTNPGTLELPWRTLARVSGHDFAPGDHIRFRRGCVWEGEFLVITGEGTANSPIVYETYGSGDPPRIRGGGVGIDGAAHIILTGLEVEGGDYAGISLQNGAQHVVISGTRLHHNAAGIWMGNGVGMHNRIIGNVVYLNKGNGIAVDSAFCVPGEETIIAANEIYSNAWHGIELSGNYHIVEGNIVHGNGANPDGTDNLVGHSGIHLFSRYHESDPDQGGDHNIIRGNIVYDTRDRNAEATDGNGIQMDMWCDDNLVYNNVAWGNDGPGIIIYGGSRNGVFHNTLYGNGLHLGNRWAQTQLMVASSDEVVAADNLIVNNIAFSTQADAYAVFIGETSADLSNAFAHNLYFNTAGGNLIGRGSEGAIPLSEWNRTDWADDLVGDPRLANIATGDVHLLPDSPAIDAGERVSWLTSDFEGDPRPSGGYDIGADEAYISAFKLFLPLVMTPEGTAIGVAEGDTEEDEGVVVHRETLGTTHHHSSQGRMWTEQVWSIGKVLLERFWYSNYSGILVVINDVQHHNR